MRFVATLAASIAAGVVLSVSANAQNQSPRPSPQANDSITVDPKADAPWSEERMRNATEITPPLIDVPSLRQMPAVPSAPPPLPPASGRYGDAQDLSGGKFLPSERAGSSTSYPLRWAGRLFWSRPGNGQWVDNSCSAQFIAPNMILTAAHCVRNEMTGEWGRNFQMALQFDRGRYSQVYRPLCLGTRPDAYQQGPDDMSWRGRDYALLLSDQPSQTGHFGWQLDWRGAYPEATVIGYPTAIDQGNVVQVINGPLLFPPQLGGNIVVIQEATSAFRHGASGGAWVGNFRTDGGSVGNRVISVSSARSKDSANIPGHMLGPYFDDGFKQLYEYVARGCR